MNASVDAERHRPRSSVPDLAYRVLVAMARTIGVLAIIVGGITFAATVVNVVNRLWLEGSLRGLDEVARFSLGWFTALAAAYATANRAHFTLNFVLRRLTHRHFGVVSEYLADLTGLIVGGLLLVGGIKWMPQAAMRSSLGLEISLAWVHVAVPVLGALIIIFSVLRLLAGQERLATGRTRLQVAEEEYDAEEDPITTPRVGLPPSGSGAGEGPVEQTWSR